MKPVSGRCNIDCDYCFYKNIDHGIMSMDTVHRVIGLCFEGATLGWQGGEPTLAGLDFYQKLMDFCPINIKHTLMTNGILIDKSWAEFLAKYNFLVGVSIDGKESHHNTYRSNWKQTVAGIRSLLEYNVSTNAVVAVSKANWNHGVQLYRALTSLGLTYFQFIPICDEKYGINDYEWGEFLISIFREWMPKDIDRVGVQLFSECVRNMIGEQPTCCVYNESCGGFVVEADGRVYCCEHFIDDNFLGNIHETDFMEMAHSIPFQSFNTKKYMSYCTDCRHLGLCHGGCIKHRAIPSGPNLLCRGYQRFFDVFVEEIAPLR